MSSTSTKRPVITLLLLLLEVSLLASIGFLSHAISLGAFAFDIKLVSKPTFLIELLSMPVIAFGASGMAFCAWGSTLLLARKSTWLDQNLSAHGWLILMLVATLGLFIYTFASPIFDVA